ncbi:MAG TPA: hypothetical protein VGL53_23305 [Bryobacteraceae bacterium]|jgi:hypothetical protein
MNLSSRRWRDNQALEASRRPDIESQRQANEIAWDERLQMIDWSQYDTAYGIATEVPEQLRKLRSRIQADALSASRDLWCGLCHQHVQIASASLPALPFLIEVFATAGDELRVEILDILLGLAITSNPVSLAEFAKATGSDPAPLPWIAEVRSALIQELPRIAPLRTYANQYIADFSTAFVEELLVAGRSPEPQFLRTKDLQSNFDDAAAAFAKFVHTQSYPPFLMWVKQTDVVLFRWRGELRNYVWKGDQRDRYDQARSEYQSAIFNGAGVVFEAKCMAARRTICRVFVPDDAQDAEQRMVPKTGVKYSAATNPLPVVLIQNKFLWRIVRWLSRNSPSVWA